MSEIRIDPEFKALIPPLTVEEYAGLEESIVREGCRDALVLWMGILIDGHNRYEICQKHGIPFETREIELDDRDEAIMWIIMNQFSRRNLPAYERARLALRLKPMIAEKAKGQQIRKSADFVSQKSVEQKPIDTQKELARAAGVSHDTIHKVETIEAKADDKLKADIMAGKTSINQAYKEIKQAEKKKEIQEKIQEQIEKPKTSNHVDIFTTDKKYRVIYADPPWSYNDKMGAPGMGGAVNHYPTMPLDDICSLPVPASKNAVLFLWTTSPQLEDSFKVINAWGFKYKSSFVWDKVAHGMGHYNSIRHEFLLVAVKGSCVPDVQSRPDSVISIERTEHSRKPAAFRNLIDALYPIGDRLEMFAREAPAGWDVWGNMA